MNIQKVAQTLLDDVGFTAKRDEHGRTVEHALWMLLGIASGYIQNEKAHRWLGYAQGILVHTDIVTLSDMKDANKR